MVYVVNLCDFFKTIQVKDPFSDTMIEKNRLEYSLEKFEQCVNGKYFSDIPILLAFTFVDVFKEALKQFPLNETRKNSIEHFVQQLNPAAQGQKQTEPKVPSIQHKFGDSTLEEWHTCCEFIIEQFIHVATSQERREEMRRNVVVLNCLDVKKSTQVLVNEIILNTDIMAHLQFNEHYYGTSSQQHHSRTPSIHEKFKNSSTNVRDHGPQSDRTHYRRPPLLMDRTTNDSTSPHSTYYDYSQYYYRRCKNVDPLSMVSSNNHEASKITKQRKRKEKHAKATARSWGSIPWNRQPSASSQKQQESVVVVLDEASDRSSEDEIQVLPENTDTTARRKRKSSNNCLLQ